MQRALRAPCLLRAGACKRLPCGKRTQRGLPKHRRTGGADLALMRKVNVCFGFGFSVEHALFKSKLAVYYLPGKLLLWHLLRKS